MARHLDVARRELLDRGRISERARKKWINRVSRLCEVARVPTDRKDDKAGRKPTKREGTGTRPKRNQHRECDSARDQARILHGSRRASECPAERPDRNRARSGRIRSCYCTGRIYSTVRSVASDEQRRRYCSNG